MTALISYEFYTGTYGGDVVPQSAFARIAVKATAIIGVFTRGRADAEDAETGEAVKLAACAVSDIVYRSEAGSGRLPISEGIAGDYNATYESGQGAARFMQVCYTAARPFLITTGLLHMGVTQ